MNITITKTYNNIPDDKECWPTPLTGDPADPDEKMKCPHLCYDDNRCVVFDVVLGVVQSVNPKDASETLLHWQKCPECQEAGRP